MIKLKYLPALFLLLFLGSITLKAQPNLQLSFDDTLIEDYSLELDTIIESSEELFEINFFNSGTEELILEDFSTGFLTIVEAPTIIAPNSNGFLIVSIPRSFSGNNQFTSPINFRTNISGKESKRLVVNYFLRSTGIRITYRDFSLAREDIDFHNDTLDFGVTLKGLSRFANLNISNTLTNGILALSQPQSSEGLSLFISPDTLNSGQTITESLRVPNDSSGVFVDSVSIATNISERNPYRFYVKREVVDSAAVIRFGRARSISFTPERNTGSVSAEVVQPGDTSVIQLFIRNVGNKKLFLSDINLTPPFQFRDNFITELDTAESLFFEIFAVQDVEDNLQGSFTFNTNDPNTPFFELSLFSQFQIFRPSLETFFTDLSGNRQRFFRNTRIDVGLVEPGNTVNVNLEFSNSRGRGDLLMAADSIEEGVELEGFIGTVPPERTNIFLASFTVNELGAFNKKIRFVSNDISLDTLNLEIEGEAILFPIAINFNNESINFREEVEFPTAILGQPIDISLELVNLSLEEVELPESLSLPKGLQQLGILPSVINARDTIALNLQVLADSIGSFRNQVIIPLSNVSVMPFEFYVNYYVDRVISGENHLLENINNNLPSSITFFDVDDDGDQDVVGGTSGSSLFFAEQENGVMIQHFNPLDNPFANITLKNNGRMTTDFIDFDADGDMDLLILSENQFPDGPLEVGEVQGSDFTLYENEGGVFTQVNQNENPFSLEFNFPGDNFLFGFGIQLSMGVSDIDNDNDPDVVVFPNNGFSYLFENTDGVYSIEASKIPQLRRFVQSPAFGDIDNDGDEDVIVGGQSGRIQIAENELDTFRIVRNVTYPVNINQNEESLLVVPFPALVDIDNDGDLDLFTLVNRELGVLFFENEGFANLIIKENDLIQAKDTIRFGDIENSFVDERELSFQNTGNLPLSLTIDELPRGVSISQNDLIIEPNEIDNITFNLNDIGRSMEQIFDSLTVLSNDPVDSLVSLKILSDVENVVASNVTDPALREINIFPNPSEGVFYLRLDEQILGMLSISILDFSGKKIASHKLLADDRRNIMKIDLSGHGKGIYLLTIETEGNLEFVRKLLVD